MKKILFFLTSILLISCQEVIDLELETNAPELVIDASLDWKVSEASNIQKVKLYKTNSYYTSEQPEKISDAEVEVTTYFGERFVFNLNSENEFECHHFTPELDKDYLLKIKHNGQEYTSKARMRKAPVIDVSKIVQIDNAGVNKDRKSIRILLETEENQENSFFAEIKFLNQDKVKDRLYAFDDKFFKSGEALLLLSEREDEKEVFEKDKEIQIRVYRVSSQYKQIVELMLGNALDAAGAGPPAFSIPSRVNGNIYNEQNPKQNPLGAFRVAQYTEVVYKIK